MTGQEAAIVVQALIKRLVETDYGTDAEAITTLCYEFGRHTGEAIIATEARVRQELTGPGSWTASAVKDYERLAQLLRDNGITKWDDTVSAVERLVAQLKTGAATVPCPPAYDPEYGDDRLCVCGHSYGRHFDSHNEWEPVGCKYCRCDAFEEAPEIVGTKRRLARDFNMNNEIGGLDVVPAGYEVTVQGHVVGTEVFAVAATLPGGDVVEFYANADELLPLE